MIDIHSHILYDIDDGSESLDMSLQMLRMSVDSGVTDIIATPHVNRQGHIPAWQTILDKVAALQEEADKAQIPIRIYTGAEVEINGDALRFMKENHDDYCLAGSRYVMLELTDQSQPDIVEKMIYELQMRGFLPLLAHEELDRLAAKDKQHVNLWNTATRNAECILKNRVFYPDLPSHWQKEKKGFFHRLFG